MKLIERVTGLSGHPEVGTVSTLKNNYTIFEEISRFVLNGNSW